MNTIRGWLTRLKLWSIINWDFLKKKTVKHRSQRYHELYNNCRNRVNKLTKVTKATYFKNKLENIENSKEGWKAINLLLNKKSKSKQIHEIKDGDNTVTGDKNLASRLSTITSLRLALIWVKNYHPITLMLLAMSNQYQKYLISRTYPRLI